MQKAKDKHPGLDAKALRKTPEYQAEMQKYGTGSDMQRAAQAVTGALQALAGNNLAGALASGAAPYLAREIKARVGENNAAAAKQLGKIVDANVKVVAKRNVDGSKFTDTNQGIRPSQLADFNKPTLINDVVQAKIVKEPNKNFPNGNMGTAHAEIGVIQQAYEKGMTNGKDMLMSVSGEALCTYCLSDVKTMAAKSGLKSLTIYEEKSGDVLYWESGMKKFIRK